jgi:predicted phosphodiesterase
MDYDLLLLLGDYSYDIYNDFGTRGDDYFDWMEPLMTRAPVILVPGNHENFDTSRMLNNRFIMPGTRHPDDNNLFALETQLIQVLGLNLDYLLMNPDLTEDYTKQVKEQMADFDSRKNNRFSFYMTHRPFHSKKNYNECELLVAKFGALEKVLLDSNLNVNLWGHVHRYERLPAIYRHKELKDKNMISLIIGTGGNKEGLGHHGKLYFFL